uniref:HORMA domain-containing protein n=1 Tax=Strigamia maritima TaxID=126957 RepID=T1IXW8_STRMM
MATMQKERNSASTWEKYCPTDMTQKQSVLFMKKLLVMAVSNITYLRNILPEYAFEDKALLGLKLKILKDQVNPKASQMIKWLKGCFDALERQYLRQMIIGIYEKNCDPECLLESYNFRFSYQDGLSVTVDKNDSETFRTTTRTSTLTMLRTILVLTNSLDALPNDVKMIIKLHYYDEKTPEDYQPPGFRDCPNENFTYAVPPLNIEVGEVETPFNILKLRVKTDSRQFNGEFKANLQDELQPELMNNMGDENEQTIALPQKQNEPVGVRCACNDNENSGLMILCQSCNYWQHAICFRILDEKAAPMNHVCNLCVKMKNPKRQPSDPSLVSLSSIATQAICMWRRAIGLCWESRRINVDLLMAKLRVDTKVADGLLLRLKNEGFIKKRLSKNGGHNVDKKLIDTVGKAKYFDLVYEPAPVLEKPSNEVENRNKVIPNDDVATLAEKTRAMSMKDPTASVSQTTGNYVTVRKGQKRAFTGNDGQAFNIASSQDTTFYNPGNVTPIKKWKTSSTASPAVSQ